MMELQANSLAARFRRDLKFYKMHRARAACTVHPREQAQHRMMAQFYRDACINTRKSQQWIRKIENAK